MKRQTLTPWAAAILIVLSAAVLAIPTYAGSQPGAALGPVLTGGTLYSGGSNFYYTVNVTAFTPGALSVQAQVKAKGWKAEFPVLAEALDTGESVVTSEGIMVPADFQGPATLKIKATYNGKKLEKKSLEIVIGAPPPPTPATPQTTLYDVGFNAAVTLNADIASTNGLGPITSYAWTQTSGPEVTLSNSATATPAFTTLSITNFVVLGHELGVVGVDAEQVSLSTYKFQVVISDGALSSTGTVTVLSGSILPGQISTPLGLNAYLKVTDDVEEHPSNSWSLVAVPAGSATTLKDSKTRTPYLRPDKEGEYKVKDNISGQIITLKSATFIGANACAECHGPVVAANVGLSDYYTPWSMTKHASFFQRAIDGLESDHYSESCVGCHTVGYNKTPTAVNGGFDDVAAATGWTFPNPLQPGNFSAMPTALKDKSNIQCETCHGPGSQHPGAASISLAESVCASCHQDGNHHTRPEQWESSPHAEPYELVSEEEGTNPSCAKCHSPAGFVDTMKGVAPIRAEIGKLTCQTCHDPHNIALFPDDAHQVRIYDNVTLDDSVYPNSPPVLTGQGTSALCMFCHNSRRGPPPTFISSGSNGTRVPHESTATDVLLGIRASTNVQSVVSGVTNTIASVTLQNSPHTTVAKCTSCHMYPNPESSSPDHNRLGDHTFSMSYVNDSLEKVENLAACNQCHAGVDTVVAFDHVGNAGEDFDGDGAVEGVQSEVDGLMTNIKAKMSETGLTFGSSGSVSSGSYSTNPVVRAVQRNAAWNQFLIERDLSKGVHNTALTVRVLQWSYTVLSTNAVPAGNPYWVDYPAAFIK